MTSIQSTDVLSLVSGNLANQPLPPSNPVQNGTAVQKQAAAPAVDQDALSDAAKNSLAIQFKNDIRDTTNAILDELKTRMEKLLSNASSFDYLQAQQKSIQVGQAIALEGNQGLVRLNPDQLQKMA
jgi:transcription elongation GreA/GreB family factor